MQSIDYRINAFGCVLLITMATTRAPQVFSEDLCSHQAQSYYYSQVTCTLGTTFVFRSSVWNYNLAFNDSVLTIWGLGHHSLSTHQRIYYPEYLPRQNCLRLIRLINSLDPD